MAAPRSDAFARALVPAVFQAAAIASALEGRVANRPKSGESSEIKAALTIADSAAQEAILVRLLERFPDVSLEAEEDTPSVGQFPTEADGLVVIDPIDGTLRSYLQGQGPYAVMVGLAVRDRFVAGLVALPREGLLFEAFRGGGARVMQGRRPPQPAGARVTEDDRMVLLSYDAPDGVEDELRARGFEVAHGSGGAIAIAPLIPGVRAGLRIAADRISRRGRIAAFVAREAGLLLRSELGAFPTSLDGPARTLRVATSEQDLGQLAGALATAGL